MTERLGVPERVARTAAGLGSGRVVRASDQRWLFGDLTLDFSIFILSGLMIVIGASWTIMYNADLLVAGVTWTFGRFRSLAPVLRMSMAYPLRNRFRTGVTLAMFTLVVFTLVTGATTTTSFVNGMNDMQTYGGGFDVRATVSPTASVADMPAALAQRAGHRPGRLPGRLGPVVPAGEGAPGGRAGRRRGLRRARPRRRVSHAHHLRSRGAGEGVRVGCRGVAGA